MNDQFHGCHLLAPTIDNIVQAAITKTIGPAWAFDTLTERLSRDTQRAHQPDGTEAIRYTWWLDNKKLVTITLTPSGPLEADDASVNLSYSVYSRSDEWPKAGGEQ